MANPIIQDNDALKEHAECPHEECVNNYCLLCLLRTEMWKGRAFKVFGLTSAGECIDYLSPRG